MNFTHRLFSRARFLVAAVVFGAVVGGATVYAEQPAAHHHTAPGVEERSSSSSRIGSRDLYARPDIAKDGWHAWTVDALDGAPNWCCAAWPDKQANAGRCDLDGRSYGFSSMSKKDVTEKLGIYVKVNRGRIESIRAYGASCIANSEQGVTYHANVSTKESLGLLSKQLEADGDTVGDAMAAIAIHSGTQAQKLLLDASGADQAVWKRKPAIFWMGQVRSRESAAALAGLVRSEPDDEIREHAVFSVSQSDLDERVSLIERVGRADRVPKVRGQAWFWLSQTRAPEAGQRILEGMRHESNSKVLEEAVFALSQLPGDEAVDALVRVIEQPNQGRALRKRALFWLAQDDSPRAIDYLAEVLDR